MKIRKVPALLIIMLWFITSCEKDKVDVNTTPCTMEFRTVSVTVIGDSLTQTHTIRIKTGDTLDVVSMPFPRPENGIVYTVLDDNFLSEIKNSEEMFRFVGLINDSVAVDELYRISADHCHIHLEQGNNEVVL